MTRSPSVIFARVRRTTVGGASFSRHHGVLNSWNIERPLENLELSGNLKKIENHQNLQVFIYLQGMLNCPSPVKVKNI